MSKFGAFISTVGGLLFAAIFETIICMVFGIDPDNIPVILTLILWVVFAIVISIKLSKHGW